MGIDRKSVKKIVGNQGATIRKQRSDKLVLDEELIIKTFKKCDEWGERTHEELEKLGIKIAYPTLMKKIREMVLKENAERFSTPSPDVPGAEFQHDLSPYVVKVGDQRLKLQASMLHYRYSKMNYLKFYSSFNRFNMKSFFYEAFQYFGYVPKQCVIDNTSLVIDRGSGKNAVFNKDMVDFAKCFGFDWYAHAIKHSDRKAGVERSFYTITTNFFPGREFLSLEDLNGQAKKWCESRFKKMNKNKIIPIDRFEYEKDFMTKVIPDVGEPYQHHARIVDQEGYIAFGTNLYWSFAKKNSEVTVLQYTDRIMLYQARKLIGEHPLPPFGTREKKFEADGVKIPYRPKKTTIPPHDEEKELRNVSKLVNDYLDFALKTFGPQNRYQFIREVYSLYKNLTSSLFVKTIERAFKYRIRCKNTLEKIAIYIMNRDEFVIPELDVELAVGDMSLYMDGQYGREPDLTTYDKWGGGNEQEC